MARARNIKPGFFRNADLAELPVEARLLFIGLWTMADREGRMEDRPKQIKMELMPSDSVDCDALLGKLESIGMIERYEVDGKRYLHIVNFTKHQNPHRDEKSSTVPAPCKHDANTVAIGLNPDSLIPESRILIPEIVPTVLVVTPSAQRLPSCPNQEIIDLFHNKLPTLPRVEVLNDGRKRTIAARWREVCTDPDIAKSEDVRQAALDWFSWYFGYASSSPFLTGKAKDWRADIDFLLTQSKFAKVVEGHYHKEKAA